MAPDQDHQVEKLVDQALKYSKFQDLEQYLLDETREGLFFKCSRQFLSKLDKLINRELDHRNMKHVSVVFTILHKLGDMLVFPGDEDISVLVSQGLVTKMVQWFEKIRQFWVEVGPMRNEVLINLAEDFFDALMVVHQSSKEGMHQVTESLLHHIGKLASDARVNILIQKEAVKKLNVILGKIPVELKKEKKILTSQEASSVMDDLAGHILKGGDYDLQVALMEALCRMTSHAQRRDLADRWFRMEFVASAFSKIQDSEFETDCRKFLNLVNGIQGDGRSVFSYPCLEVFLDKQPLLMPVDENLKEFWIDFNLGSQSISFYFCLAGDVAQEGQWDTLCIAENEVCSYTVEEEKDVKVLQLVLIEPLCLSNCEGSRLFIHFSASLDILQATKKVYGEYKNKKFIPKTTTSVVKTTVQIILDDGGSQVLFPESQGSSQPKETAVPMSVRSNTPSHSSLSHERAAQHLNQQTITPLRSKVSESCMYVSGSAGRQLGKSPFSCVLPTSTPVGKAKVKPALEMVASETKLRELLIARPSHNMPSDQENVKKQQIPVDKVLEMVQANQEEPLDNSIVPDSQPAMRKGTSMLPGLCDITNKKRISVSGSLLPCQRDLSQHQSKSELPPRPSSAQHTSARLSHKQLHAQLTHRLEKVLWERELQAKPCPAAQKGVSSLEQHLPEPASLGKGPGLVKGFRKPTPAKPAQSKQPKGSLTEMSKDTVKPAGLNVKKHLFSDSDTDNMTEVSWLKSANRKPRPKVADYTRQPSKPSFPTAETTIESPSVPVLSDKAEKLLLKSKRKRQKKVMEQEDKKSLNIASRMLTSRPQRSAALTKCYKEPSDSEREFETDESPPTKKLLVKQPERPKSTVSLQTRGEPQKTASLQATGRTEKKDETCSYGMYKQPEREKKQSEESTTQLETDRLKLTEEKADQELMCPEQTESKKSPDPQQPSKQQEEPWAAKFDFFCPSHFSIEKMRSVENSADFPRSPLTPLQPLPISPVGVVSPPMELPSHLKGIQASSFYKTSGGYNGAKFPIHPPVTIVAQKQSSIQPLIASTGRETLAHSFPLNSADIKENLGDLMNSRSLQASFDKESVMTLSQSSHRSRNNITMICTEVENTPACMQGSRTEEKDFQSGPATRRKRHSSRSSISLSETDNSEEEEEGGTKFLPRELTIKMKPRRLFKPTDKPQPNNKGFEQPVEYQNSSEEEDKENVSPRPRVVEDLDIHSTVLSNVVSSCWDASVEADVDVPQPSISTSQDMSIFCHQFSSELKRKFESRSRKMDLFAKQSLKAFKQHVSSVSVQVLKYRSQRLEKVKQVIMDEIKNLEQDDTALCNMEKELTTYWKKQALAFNAYHERGTRRLQNLKSAIELNMCDSLEYEEQIFSAEMCLMKKDMRSVQDRLFKQMQEEELLSMRRGLQTLFLQDVSMF
ncbi:synaptonemal complex protein 2 [Electrophorus electricus]|uniref:synaptonemal complex protein 2 n=1 Tax=Electrophorus electricus TaxID=8005 RepID=UPI0015CFB9B6|nr:synaptonemal complex protein 2 [Electrophorus electricus]